MDIHDKSCISTIIRFAFPYFRVLQSEKVLPELLKTVSAGGLHMCQGCYFHILWDGTLIDEALVSYVKKSCIPYYGVFGWI